MHSSMEFDPFATSEYMGFSGSHYPADHHFHHPSPHILHHPPQAQQQAHHFQQQRQQQHRIISNPYHRPEHPLVHPQQRHVLLAQPRHAENGFSGATHGQPMGLPPSSSFSNSTPGDSQSGVLRGDDVSLDLVAEKTMEKRRANAEAARRSRQRRAQKLSDIAEKVASVESENSELMEYVARLEAEKRLWTAREKELKAQNAALKKKLDAALLSTSACTLETSSSSATLNELQ